MEIQSRYEQICTDIRFTDDISLKLLGFMPLVTGAGIFPVLFAGPDREVWQAAVLGAFVGLLGATMTFAIYRWEVRNLNFCKYLREQVAYLEEHGALDGQHGHYLGRPDAPIWPPWKKDPSNTEAEPQKEASNTEKEPRRVGKTEAERILYTAVFISWLALPALAAILA